MNHGPPTRWRAPSSDAPSELRALLAEAGPPVPLTHADRTALASRLAHTFAGARASSTLHARAGLGLKVSLAALVLVAAAPRVHQAPTERRVAAVVTAATLRAPAPWRIGETHASAAPAPTARVDNNEARPSPHRPPPRRAPTRTPGPAVHDAPGELSPPVLPPLRDGDPSLALGRLATFVATYGDRAHSDVPPSTPLGRAPTR